MTSKPILLLPSPDWDYRNEQWLKEELELAPEQLEVVEDLLGVSIQAKSFQYKHPGHSPQSVHGRRSGRSQGSDSAHKIDPLMLVDGTRDLDHDIGATVEDALLAIGNVIQLPDSAPPVSLRVLDLGAKVHAEYRLKGNEITVSAQLSPPAMQTAVIHEFGHYLDESLFGNEKMYDSHNPYGKTAKVMEAIHNSGTWRELESEAATYGMDEFHTPEYKHARYLLNDHELFARAFTQYIANKPKNKHLQDQVDGEEGQWYSDEFDFISQAFDDLFKAEGMLV